MAALYFFCLSVGWVYAQIQSIAHWVQPLFQDQISKGSTMEDDNSFSLLAKNLKKRSFEARSDTHSWNILG